MTATIPAYTLDTLPGLLTGSARIPEDMREYRMDGGDWDEESLTMVGDRRLFHLLGLIERAVYEGVEGDVIECGVWRGGCSIYMRAVLDSLGSRKTVWVADSFKGCPEGDEHHGMKFLSVSQWEVDTNFARFGLLDDDRVRFVPGFFADSLPGPVGPLALLRVDCDMYESTRVVLERLYPLVSPGGFVVLDDYKHLNTAKRAVDDVRKAQNITEPLVIDPDVAWWRKL